MSSKIKLIIEKGPREGETLEYNSTSVVKIGRVVRGNTIAIKDAGISTKHISIQFDNQLLQWTLIDLDSSNGTILNGLNVKPCVPSGLSDGDGIKIGDLTSMIVRIVTESEVVGRSVRRNPRRNSKVVGVVDSDLGSGVDEAKAVEEVAPKRNLRPRGRKVAVVEEEKEKEMEFEVGQKRDLRRRGRKVAEEGKEKEVEVEVGQKRTLPPRGRKVSVAVQNEKLKEVEVEVGQKGTVPSRGRKVAVAMQNEKLKEVEVEIGQKRTLPPRGRKVAVAVQNEKEKAVEVEAVQKREVRGRGKKSVEVETEKGAVEEDVKKPDLRAVVESDGDAKGVSVVESQLGLGVGAGKAAQKRNLRPRGRKVEVAVENEKEKAVEVEAVQKREVRVLRQEGCEGKEGVVDGRLIKSPSEIPDMDMGKKLPVKGIPNTNRKYREDNKVIWHDTPFETRLDRALNRHAAEASSRVELL